MVARESEQNSIPAIEEAPIREIPGSHPMEIWISYVLRIGVILSAIVILIGVVLFLIQGPRTGDPHSLHDLLHSKSISLSVTGIFRGVAHAQGTSVIIFGAFLLILTPITRVLMTNILFGAQRDRSFILITAVVLAVLVFGLTGINV